MTSRFSLHVQNWKDCQECGLGQQRNRICLARGSVPADILFVGEAPGDSENVIGQPFVGPAGKLLDQIVRLSVPMVGFGGDGPIYRVAYTNLVACLPRYDGSFDEPDADDIKACSPRLKEFVGIVRPRLIVAVGALAASYLTGGTKHQIKFKEPIRTITITHPSAVLRANITQRELMIQRAVATVATAVDDMEAPTE